MLCTDPYVPDPALVPLERVLAEADVLFVATPHRAYRDLRIPAGKLLFDVWSWIGSGFPMRVLVTGSAGFIAGYLVAGAARRATRSSASTTTPSMAGSRRATRAIRVTRFVEGDAKDVGLLTELAASATTSSRARRGSAASPTSTSTPTTCWRRTSGSSPPASTPPSRPSEGQARRRSPCSPAAWSSRTPPSSRRPKSTSAQCPPPTSTYGFQKLACEYFARGACEQYRLPYTICRPFNCVGIGERRALGGKDIPSGNIRLAMSHVVPDLVQKVLKGQDPLHILGQATRCAATPTAATWPAASLPRSSTRPRSNEDFNLSTPEATTVLELAE